MNHDNELIDSADRAYMASRALCSECGAVCRPESHPTEDRPVCRDCLDWVLEQGIEFPADSDADLQARADMIREATIAHMEMVAAGEVVAA
jgi:hypothetical protein